jgi:O-antigen/teichoic acid export membrane protein
MISKLLNNQFVKGSLIFSLASFAVSFINYLFNLLVARGMSLANYGEYMSALSYAMVLAIPLTGLGAVVVRRLGAKEKTEQKQEAFLLESWIINQVRTKLLPILVLLLPIGWFLITKSNLLFSSIFFVFLYILFSSSFLFYNSVFQGFKNFKLAGSFSLGQVLFKIIGGLVAVLVFKNLLSVYLVIIFSYILSAFVGHFLIRPKKLVKTPVQKTLSLQNVLRKKVVWLPILANLGIFALINMDLILVKKLFSPDEVGLYAALSLLGKIIFFVIAPLTLVAFSFFSNQAEKINKKKIFLFSNLIILIVSGVTILTYRFFPELVINIIFGNKFLPLKNIIWIAAIFGAIYSLANIFFQHFLSKLSKISLLPIGIVFLQIFGIYFFHQNFKQVYFINIASVGLLFLLFLIFYLKEHLYEKSK